MRLFDNSSDKGLTDIILLLTRSEAAELRDSLNDVLKQTKWQDYHLHVDDSEYKHEITVALYEPDSPNPYFAKRIQQLVAEDK